MIASARRAGPRGTALTGNLAEFARDPLEFLTRSAREFGPLTALRFGRMRAMLVSDPAMIEEILVRRRLDFTKAEAIRAQRRLFGKGLLINEGESWARQRKLTQPAFHPGNLAPYVPVIAEHTKRMLDSWRAGETRDFHQDAQSLLMGIVAESLFGPEVAPHAAAIGSAVEAAMRRYSARRGAARFLPDWVPLEESRSYVEGISELDEFISATVAHRRGKPEKGHDLLQVLLDTRDEAGAVMSSDQIRDEAVNLFVGGFDTPALSLAWTWHLLARHPRVAAKVAAEVDIVLGPEKDPSLSDLSRLVFTQKVLKESMRLYPPAWLLGRLAAKDTEIGGTPVRKGTTLLLSQWVMHRDERYFTDALSFKPERWDQDMNLPRFVYFPFGAGPRVCIGAAFATLECTFVLAMIARRFGFVSPSSDDVEPVATMTLRPKGGMPATIVPR